MNENTLKQKAFDKGWKWGFFTGILVGALAFILGALKNI